MHSNYSLLFGSAVALAWIMSSVWPPAWLLCVKWFELAWKFTLIYVINYSIVPKISFRPICPNLLLKREFRLRIYRFQIFNWRIWRLKLKDIPISCLLPHLFIEMSMLEHRTEILRWWLHISWISYSAFILDLFCLKLFVNHRLFHSAIILHFRDLFSLFSNWCCLALYLLFCYSLDYCILGWMALQNLWNSRTELSILIGGIAMNLANITGFL